MGFLTNKLVVGSALSSLKSAAQSAVQSVAQTAAQTISQSAAKPAAAEENNLVAVDSVEAMTSCLESIKTHASPAMLQVLKTQTSILSSVNSPALVGMTMDNMTECLITALEKSEEVEKTEIRKLFARMLQNSVFLAEAKLKYASDTSRKEGARLLEEAGSMLTETMKDIAEAAAPGEAGALELGKPVAANLAKSDFFGRIGTFFGNKKIIDEKQKEFNGILDNIFVMLDKYPQYYGKSVTINGIVAKYREQLIDAFADRKLQPIMDKMSAIQLQTITDTVGDLSTNLLRASGIGAVTGLIKAGGKILEGFANKKSNESSLRSFCRNVDAYEDRLRELEQKVSEAENKLAELKQADSEVGFFSFNAKKESKEKMQEQKAVLEQSKADLKSAEQNFNSLMAICPEARSIKKEIDDYETFLDNLEAKYAL